LKVKSPVEIFLNRPHALGGAALDPTVDSF